jgi:Fe-Mn family superoxide dismutase
MRYEIAPLFCRPWTLNGITPRLIESHYENNYGGAVHHLNAITEELEALRSTGAAAHAVLWLKQEEMAALNSVLLHELYFASLGGDGRAIPEGLAAAMTRDFGAVDRWRFEFTALADALAARGGWVLLTWLPGAGRLLNQSVTDVSPGIAGGIPILALDMYEHAYRLDFGANATAYVAAFMRNIEWKAVQARYDDAVLTKPPRPLEQKEFAGLPSVSVNEVNAMLQSNAPVQVLDVRPRHYSARAQDIVEGATWRDPERVSEWIGELSKDTPVVTYCVYGFHIGCETAATLREAGFEARYMAGGHSAWKAAKGPVTLFDPAKRVDEPNE